jgi:hypothetical protein
MAASRQAERHAEDYVGPVDHGPCDGDGDGDVAGDREAPHDEKIAAADESVGVPPRSVQEQLSQALAELLARAAELRSKDAEVALLKADADALRAEVGELRAKAAEAEEQRVEADELRLVRTKLEESENDLLRLRKETEQVRHEDTLLDTMKTITSKTKMEKIGSTLVHLEPEQLRLHFTKLLNQALPSPPSAGAQPPAAIMHVVSEKDSVVLLYRNLAVRNKVGIATAAELFEFHLLVAEDPEDPSLITLRTLSDDDAKRLCGAEYLSSVEAKRQKVDLRKLKRVQVRSYADRS